MTAPAPGGLPATGPDDPGTALLEGVADEASVRDALLIAEERYRRTIEGVDAIVFFQPWLGGPAYVSPQVRTILGYEPADVADMQVWNSHVHPDDLPRALEAWLGPEDHWKIEFRMQRADGTWIWVSDQGRRLPRTDGLGDGSFGFVQDITARHEAERRLRESEERFRAVVEENPESITLVTPIRGADGSVVDAEIIGANRISRERHFGGEPLEAIIGKRALEVSPALRAPILGAIAEVADTGRPFRGETAWAYDGVTAWSDVSIFPFEGGLAIVGRDITAGKLAEAAVRESEARYRAVADSAADAIITADEDQRIVGWNRAAERLFGIPAEAAVGQPVGIIQPPDVIEAHKGIFSRLVDDPARHPTGSAIELLARRADGTDFPVELSLSDWELQDRRYVTAIIRDVSGLRTLESQLRQAQRLEAIGQLAGGVAHDFNNLLAAITGYGEFVQASLPVGSEIRRDMDQVLRAADRAAELTRQLLAFSRRQALDLAVLDPADVVEGVAPMLRRLLGEHITLVASRSPGHVRVRVDRGQLEQVIVNLVVNARDAMPDGGRVELATGTAILSAEDVAGVEGMRPGPVARITVTDTGGGMDEATLARIYDPFFTTKEVGRGTGLGLATVYGIVRACDGRITAHSAVGRGTTFTIDLPLVPAEAPAPARPGSGTHDRPAMAATVLLVEHDPSVRTVLARHLSAGGCMVLAAESGEAALEQHAATGRVDLVVSDIRMPGMQGPELVRRIRARQPGCRVLLMSGHVEEGVLADPSLEGIGLLEKPFDAQRFMATVRSVLDAPG